MTEAQRTRNIVAFAETRADQHWADLRGRENELALIGASDGPIDPQDEDLVRRACLLVCAELDTRALREHANQLELQENEG